MHTYVTRSAQKMQEVEYIGWITCISSLKNYKIFRSDGKVKQGYYFIRPIVLLWMKEMIAGKVFFVDCIPSLQANAKCVMKN